MAWVFLIGLIAFAIVAYDLAKCSDFNANSETETFDLKTFKNLFLLNPHRFVYYKETSYFPFREPGLYYYVKEGEYKILKLSYPAYKWFIRQYHEKLNSYIKNAEVNASVAILENAQKDIDKTKKKAEKMIIESSEVMKEVEEGLELEAMQEVEEGLGLEI